MTSRDAIDNAQARGLHDRTILVTGAGSGIGRAVAVLAARCGARIVVLDVMATAAQACADDIHAAGGDAIAVRCDVSNERQVTAAFADVSDRGIIIDGAFTGAGIDLGGPAHQLDADDWRRVLDVNLTGSFLVCREALAMMVASGRRGGSIVLCSSPAAQVGFAAGNASAYSASKGGVSALTRSLAVDYARHGIRINAVVPGPTETPLMWAAVPEVERAAMRSAVIAEVPLGRLAEPEEPARAVLWLLGDESSFVTGSHLVCDGGVLAKASISV